VSGPDSIPVPCTSDAHGLPRFIHGSKPTEGTPRFSPTSPRELPATVLLRCVSFNAAAHIFIVGEA
jgi:hypothetical protein